MTSLTDLIESGKVAKKAAPKKAPAGVTCSEVPAIRPELGVNDILVVGECPTQDDISNATPFSGKYARFAEQLFADCGVRLDECTRTYAICRAAPKGDPTLYCKPQPKGRFRLSPGVASHFDRLRQLIESQRPKLIIVLGNVGLCALRGESGIMKWRGSQLYYNLADGTEVKLLPTINPAVAVKKYEYSYFIKMDLRRALDNERWAKPVYNFIVRPDFSTVMESLEKLEALCAAGPTRLAVDLETRSGHIACCGIAWSDRSAICIPFMKARRESGYWSHGEERAIILKLRELFSHPNAQLETQNGSYDVQYWFRWWLCDAKPDFDTMVAHHVCWAGLKKSLDFLSSMYCRYHEYWKDDGKHFDLDHHNEEQLWEYNCKDCVVTFECATELRKLVANLKLQPQLDFQMTRNLRMVIRMMLRGVRRDTEAQSALRFELMEAASEREAFIYNMVGRNINPKSPKQIQELFYDELGQQIVIDRKTKRPTSNDDALSKIGKRTPVLRPLCNAILDIRSIGVLSSTFVNMQADTDGRIRCSYGVSGTETYRYNSSENAFGSGGNLQNIPNPAKTKGEGRFRSPNVKRMFVPDPGFQIADFDLDRADLQVVVWEAGEPLLKQLLREGVDLHLANAQVLFNLPYTIDDLRDPGILERIEKTYNAHRDFAKAFVHGTNYGGSARTMAVAAGCSVLEAEAAQHKWFSTYIGIKDWHARTEKQLMETRSVVNPFGFRRYYFDRIEGLLPEALAWVPQSTVAIVIDTGLCNVDENLRAERCEPLLQVHDSGVFQYPQETAASCLQKIRKEMEIVIPYDDPLIIPVGAKVSDKSWGDCKKWDFDKQAVAA